MAHWPDVQTRARVPGSAVLARALPDLARDNAQARARRQAGSPSNADPVPISTIKPGTDMYDILTGGGMLGGAGVAVTEQTAMAVAAVYACVALIGGAIAALPFHLYRRTAGGRDRLDDDRWWLFNEAPHPDWTAAAAWQHAAQSIGLKGDAYWRILRPTGRTNAVSGFLPLHPDTVQPFRTDGALLYSHRNDTGTIEVINPADMLHFRGIGFDGLRSITPIRAALRAGAGIALAADEYAAGFFRDGARPDFLITSSARMDEEQRKAFRDRWMEMHSGARRAHVPALLTGGDIDIKTLALSPEDAQLLTTRRFQVEDIARIFGVPPHMIGYGEKSTSWGTGIEQQSIGFVRYTLRRYLDSIQQEINRKIWPRNRQVFGEFVTDALLDGDSKAQAEYFAKALGGPGAQGWMTVNEIRRLKNLSTTAAPWADDVQRSGGATKPGSEPDTEPNTEPHDEPDADDAPTP